MSPRQIDEMLLDNSNKAIWLFSTECTDNLWCTRLVSSVRDKIELWESLSRTSRSFKDSWRF